MRIAIIFIATLVAASLFGACSKDADSARNDALQRYANETITPGVGLGDVRLGKTTLKWVTENFGEGRMSTIFGEQTAIELTFLDGQAAFLFIVSGACEKDADTPRGTMKPTRDVVGFVKMNPSCGDLPLSSLSVAVDPKDPARSFFKGATAQGVRLGSPIGETSKHGPPISRAGQLVVAESAENSERIEFAGGIYFYYDGGKGPTGDEIRSGLPMSPERLREIESSRSEAAKNRIVERITIFVPE